MSKPQMSAADLPLEVQDVMKEVLPSDDPLDRVHFDPVEFINRNFPDEDSLGMHPVLTSSVFGHLSIHI